MHNDWQTVFLQRIFHSYPSIFLCNELEILSISYFIILTTLLIKYIDNHNHERQITAWLTNTYISAAELNCWILQQRLKFLLVHKTFFCQLKLQFSTLPFRLIVQWHTWHNSISVMKNLSLYINIKHAMLTRTHVVMSLYHDGHKPWRPEPWWPHTMTMTATTMTATNHYGHKSWQWWPQPWRPQTMTATNHDHDGHNHDGHTPWPWRPQPWRPQPWRPQTMTATNHDNDGHNHDGHTPWRPQTMTVMVVAVMVMVCGCHGCGRHGHGVWPSWFVAVMVVAVMVNFVAVMVCGRHGRTP